MPCMSRSMTAETRWKVGGFTEQEAAEHDRADDG
jgi:hypothetical protein